MPTDPPRPTLLVRTFAREGREVVEVALERPGAAPLTASATWVSPVAADDARDARWLLEDYPHVRSQASTPIATRLTARFEALGAELFQRAVPASAEGEAITRALAAPGMAAALDVRVADDLPAWTPWELLRAPSSDTPLALQAASFTRLGPPLEGATDAGDGPLRVLLVIARPAGEDDVPFRSVANRLVKTLRASAVRVDVLRPPTWEAFKAALSDAAAEGAPYRVVHFDGHGVYGPDPFDPERRSRGAVLFEDATGTRSHTLNGQQIGRALAAAGVRLLFLNACRSAFSEPRVTPEQGADAPRRDRAFGSFAHAALEAGVPSVVAMGFNVYVAAAAQIVAEAYAALSAGASVGEALSLARRRRRADERALPLDWMVPVVFERAPLRLARAGAIVGAVAVRADGFVGDDDLVLRLDRALRTAPITLLLGVAGSGKSALAREIGAWIAATTTRAVAVVDLPLCPTVDAVREAIVARRAALPQRGSTLWILEDAHAMDAAAWPPAVRDAFASLARELAAEGSRVLVTSRCEVPELAGAPTLVIEGLDAASRAELAERVLGARSGAALGAWLAWTRGNPGVILGALPLCTADELDDVLHAQRALASIRAGDPDMIARFAPAIRAMGPAPIDAALAANASPGGIARAFLFQGVCTAAAWGWMRRLAEQRYPASLLEVGADDDRRRLAARAGLALTRSDGWTWLHPLAPLVTRAAFERIWTDRCKPSDAAAIRGHFLMFYVQAVTTLLVGRAQMPSARIGDFATLADEAENLWNALDLTVRHEAWEAASPLLRVARSMLLAAQRVDEWAALAWSVRASFLTSPPGPGGEVLGDGLRDFVSILADEAERVGAHGPAKSMRQRLLRASPKADVAAHAHGLDVGRNARYQALLDRGDAARAQGSAECTQSYAEALHLAMEANDELRQGQAALRLAKACIFVAGARDLVVAEKFARVAVSAGDKMGIVGRWLATEARLALGNAIAERAQAERPADAPARLAEAETLFGRVLASDVADGSLRAPAYNGIGMVKALRDDHAGAAAAFLEACREHEALHDRRALIAATAQAARALYIAGRYADAGAVARSGLEAAAAMESPSARVVDALHEIEQAAAGAMAGA